MRTSARLRRHGGKLLLDAKRRLQLEKLDRTIDIARARQDKATLDLAEAALVFLQGNPLRVMSVELQEALWGEVIRVEIKRV